MTATNYTHIEIILDRSGSMASCLHSTIAGVNEFIAVQKKVEGKCTLSLVQFDGEYEIHYQYTDIADVPYLNRETYIPRGSTALHDAVGRTITRLGQELAARPEEMRPSKVIILIQTDGQENASKIYSKYQINDMTRHQREKYGWEFIFAGTNQDAIATAVTMGIPVASAIYYSPSDYGTSNAWSVMSSNVVSSRAYGTAVNFSTTDRASTVDANDTSAYAHTVVPTITVAPPTATATQAPFMWTTLSGGTINPTVSAITTTDGSTT